jgi:hypothetical protein
VCGVIYSIHHYCLTTLYITSKFFTMKAGSPYLFYSPEFQEIQKRVKLLSQIVLIASTLLVVAIHIPPAVGHSWPDCDEASDKEHKGWCIAVFHFVDGFALVANVFVGALGYFLFVPSTVKYYIVVMAFLCSVNFTVFMIESRLILLHLDGTYPNYPWWAYTLIGVT